MSEIEKAVNHIALIIGIIKRFGYTAVLEQQFESNLNTIMNHTGLCRDKATDYAIEIAGQLNIQGKGCVA
ncbi:hypothetical protein [Viridibacillus arvi]|uniref:hypothetical protein n=1 Tax=Viridibacillus arvi TaxID=263475 RepID=UPI00187BBFB7|nr:hypothetical protein [Viridibacillus sp. JNUCC-6]QOV10918.1 hypothetical protein JNUCC6_20500 [Viridibacillus sp. JNUCC-6]